MVDQSQSLILRDTDNELQFIPPPRIAVASWVDPTCPNREEQFREWLLSQVYWNMMDSNTNKKSTIAEAVAAACAARLQVTADLRSMLDQSILRQLMEAKQLKWHMLLGKDFNSLDKILRIALKDASESESYDLLFWVDYLIPFLEYNNIDPEQVLQVPEKYSKARAGVPTMRRIWREINALYRKDVRFFEMEDGYYWQLGAVTQGPFSSEEDANSDYRKRFYLGMEPQHLAVMTNKMLGMVQMITDDTSVTTFRNTLKEINGTKLEKPALDAYMFIIGGQDWLLIQSGNKGQTEMVLNRLEGLIPYPGIRDPMTLIREINEWFATSRQPSAYYVLNLEDGELHCAPEKQGVRLPTLEAVVNNVRIEIAKAWNYIVQSNEPLYVPIVEICPSSPSYVTNMLNFFQLPQTLSEEIRASLTIEIIPKALTNLYRKTIIETAHDILPKNAKLSVDVTNFVTGYVTVCLQVTIL